MTRRAREIETLLLTMYAAVPLYLTGAISPIPLIAFHAVTFGITLRVLSGRGPDLVPAGLMRWVAVAYVPFYVVDAAMLSRSAIAASTHLVLFIAAYQPIESMNRDNHLQRLLTATLIFVASLATSTHLTVVVFIALFAFLMFRQLVYVSHLETARSVGREYSEPPTAGPALFYLGGAVLIGSLLFPFLPRVRNPFVQGLSGTLTGAATGLSDTIDFSQPRITSAESTVMARIWMDQQTRPFFTPVRLRGPIYDRYEGGEWRQTLRGLRDVPLEDGSFVLARARGVQRIATVQQKPSRGRLFLPVGAVAISGVTNLFEGPARETYYTYQDGMVNASVRMAFEAEPLRLTRIGMTGYPVSPMVEAMARGIVGEEQRPERQAAMIENYMLRNFRYLPNPTTPVATVSLDDFLLRTRAGHCEYFAAGMVVLLNALDVPARIAGGFYGGRLNPLTGYYSIRREDAHAWTEVWDGTRWLTFDSTPPSLRPGTAGANPLGEYLSAIGDSMTFFWDRYVLTFGLGDQLAMIRDALAWGSEALLRLRQQLATDIRMLLGREFLALAALLIAGGFALGVVLRRRDPFFAALVAQLRLRGIDVGPAMTVEEALRLLRERDAEAAEALQPLVALYEEERFSSRRRKGRAGELRRMVGQLRAIARDER